ncbi:MAG: efflux RND transporter periplasmic adaptor subunit [Methylovirgula sp.]
MRRSFVVLAVLAIGAVGAGYWWMHAHPPADETQNAEAPPVPVLVATAKAEDVPIILRGLGTVTAYNTVPLKSRVEGAVTEINFKEGQDVKTGDLLIQLDPRPYEAALAQAKANLAKDQAALANAQVDLQRYAKLLTQNFAPEQQYATQKALVDQDQATIQADQAAIRAAALNVDYASIRSPVDGVTGIRQVDLGVMIQANSTQTLVVVTQIEPIYVIFTLPEADIGRVREAMAKARLRVLAYASNDQKEIAEGGLNLVDNSVNQTTGTVRLKAEFANKDRSLWPGQFVNAHLVLRTIRDGVTVPTAAIQTGPNGPFAYVAGNDSKVHMRPITVAQTENNRALIAAGLKAGERVVVAGQYRLDEGTKVNATEATGTPTGGEHGGMPLDVEADQ